MDERKGKCGSGSGNWPKDLGRIVKAPLDPKNYKAIQLENGLKAVLVSTCIHELDLGKSGGGGGCLCNAVSEFNKSFLEIDSHDIPPGEDGTSKRPASSVDDGEDYGVIGAVRNLFSGLFFSGKNEEVVENHSEAEDSSSARVVRCCRGRAVACVVVGAGSFHDPPDIHGLAHLTEHVVFLGSENFPEPNALFMEVAESGGIANAYTQAEHTVYYVSVHSTRLEGCLHVLADAVKNPLMRDDAVCREVEAIDSEYGIKQTCDMTRVSDFMRSLAREGHPMRKFYWGNKESLSADRLGERLRAWKDHYYRACNTTVCISAPMPVEQLEKLVVTHFSDMVTGNPGGKSPAQELEEHGHPFERPTFAALYQLQPVIYMNTLLISWCLPKELWMDYEVKPLDYIRWMMNTKSEGGLVRYLRQRAWLSTSFYCGCSKSDNLYRNRFCSLYVIQVELTDKGVAEKDDVIAAVFSYINMLKGAGGVSRRCFEEMKRTVSNAFHFHDWDELVDNSQEIGIDLHYVPPAHVLTSRRLVTRFSEETIRGALALFSPRTCNMILVSSSGSSACTKAAWECGICHKKFEITEEQYVHLENMPVLPEFRMPPENALLAKSILLDENNNSGRSGEACGKGVLFESDGVTVAYKFDKQDWRYGACYRARVPTSCYHVRIRSPAIGQTAKRQGVWDVFGNILMKEVILALGVQFYKPFMSELSVEEDSLEVMVFGPSCRLVEMLSQILTVVFAYDAKGEGQDVVFHDYKVERLRDFINHTLDVKNVSEHFFAFLLSANFPTLFQIYAGLEHVDASDFENLVSSFRRRMFVEVELWGSVDKREAEGVIQFLSGLGVTGCDIYEQRLDRATVLPRHTALLRMQAIHPAYVVSAVRNHYQFGPWQYEVYLFVQYLAMTMARRFHTQLRTKEQLGYAVRVEPFFDSGGMGLSTMVLTQPQKYSTEHVDSRVDTFLRCFYLAYFQDEGITQRLFAPYTHAPVDYKAYKQLYRDYLLKDGGHFRKLTVQVVGFRPGLNPCGKSRKRNESGECKPIHLEYCDPGKDKRAAGKKREPVTFIANMHEFKRRLPLVPLPL